MQSLRAQPPLMNPKSQHSNNIPQVAEPEIWAALGATPRLRQNLEYSLVLDVDGTIQRIEPLGRRQKLLIAPVCPSLVNFVSRTRTAKILEFEWFNP